MRKYISIGAVTAPSSEEIVYVSHCGYDYTLTGDLAYMWLSGRYGFDTARNTLEEKALEQLRKMGLVALCENTMEGEYRTLTRISVVPTEGEKPYVGLNSKERTILKWIRETGLVLSMAELVYLTENNIEPEPQYLGQENVQTLVERIYTRDTIFDNTLENLMEHSKCRDQVVKLVLKLLRRRRVVLL